MIWLPRVIWVLVKRVYLIGVIHRTRSWYCGACIIQISYRCNHFIWRIYLPILIQNDEIFYLHESKVFRNRGGNITIYESAPEIQSINLEKLILLYRRLVYVYGACLMNSWCISILPLPTLCKRYARDTEMMRAKGMLY